MNVRVQYMVIFCASAFYMEKFSTGDHVNVILTSVELCVVVFIDRAYVLVIFNIWAQCMVKSIAGKRGVIVSFGVSLGMILFSAMTCGIVIFSVLPHGMVIFSAEARDIVRVIV